MTIVPEKFYGKASDGRFLIDKGDAAVTSGMMAAWQCGPTVLEICR
jgi:hypothetical protein